MPQPRGAVKPSMRGKGSRMGASTRPHWPDRGAADLGDLACIFIKTVADLHRKAEPWQQTRSRPERQEAQDERRYQDKTEGQGLKYDLG